MVTLETVDRTHPSRLDVRNGWPNEELCNNAASGLPVTLLTYKASKSDQKTPISSGNRYSAPRYTSSRSIAVPCAGRVVRKNKKTVNPFVRIRKRKRFDRQSPRFSALFPDQFTITYFSDHGKENLAEKLNLGHQELEIIDTSKSARAHGKTRLIMRSGNNTVSDAGQGTGSNGSQLFLPLNSLHPKILH